MNKLDEKIKPIRERSKNDYRSRSHKLMSALDDIHTLLQELDDANKWRKHWHKRSEKFGDENDQLKARIDELEKELAIWNFTH